MFNIIGNGFWNRYLYMLCDFKDLFIILQLNRFTYKQKKYIYSLIFPYILRHISQLDIYEPCIDNIKSRYNPLILLLKKNECLAKWYYAYNFKKKQSYIKCICQKILEYNKDENNINIIVDKLYKVLVDSNKSTNIYYNLNKLEEFM